MEYPCFTEAFQEVWKDFYTEENLKDIENALTAYTAPLQPAFTANQKRWETELKNYQLHYDWQQNYGKRMLRNATAWMNEHQDIAEYVKEASGVEEVIAASDFISVNGNIVTFNSDALMPGSAIVTDAAGCVMFSPTDGCDLSELQPGFYIISARTLKGETVSRKLVK